MSRIGPWNAPIRWAAAVALWLAFAMGASASATLGYDNTDCTSFTLTASGDVYTLTCVSPPGTFETSVSNTIESYYVAILGRASDSGGKTYWASEVARLKALNAGVVEAFYAMAVFFFNSPEYLARNTSDTQYVTDLYKAFFGRDPDSAGLTFWLSQLTGGMSRGALLNTFLFSSEYATTMGAIFGADSTVRAEVAMVVDFYRGLLGRLPDDAGFATWVAQFRAAQCSGSTAVTNKASEISAGFLASSEYASRNGAVTAGLRDAAYVADLYNAFMKRGGDLNGFLYWVTQIQSGSRTRENVRLQFVASTEFQTRVSAVIAQGCLP